MEPGALCKEGAGRASAAKAFTPRAGGQENDDGMGFAGGADRRYAAANATGQRLPTATGTLSWDVPAPRPRRVAQRKAARGPPGRTGIGSGVEGYARVERHSVHAQAVARRVVVRVAEGDAEQQLQLVGNAEEFADRAGEEAERGLRDAA